MGNIMVRMGVVIGILVAVQLGFCYVGHLTHPAVVEPQRPLEELSHGGQHSGDGNVGRKGQQNLTSEPSMNRKWTSPCRGSIPRRAAA